MVNVRLLAPHFDKDSRYVPEGTVVDMPVKDLSPWVSPVDATAKTEMDKKFKPTNVTGQYKRGTL